MRPGLATNGPGGLKSGGYEAIDPPSRGKKLEDSYALATTERAHASHGETMRLCSDLLRPVEVTHATGISEAQTTRPVGRHRSTIRRGLARPAPARRVSGPDGRGPADSEWGAVAVAVGGFIVVGAVASWLAAAGVIAAIEQAVIGGLMLYGVGCVVWLVMRKLRGRR